MAMQDSRAKLARGIRDLMELWSATKMEWNDANAVHFEEAFLQPLQMDLRSAANAMDQMAALLSQIQHQCD
jgi:hypothetical protein